MWYNRKCETKQLGDGSGFFYSVDVVVQLSYNQILVDIRTRVLCKNPLPTSTQSVASPVSFRTQTEVGSGFLRSMEG